MAEAEGELVKESRCWFYSTRRFACDVGGLAELSPANDPSHGRATELVLAFLRGIAVGTPVTGCPPHNTVRAAFPHTAPTFGD
jgi:hypothetical protein